MPSDRCIGRAPSSRRGGELGAPQRVRYSLPAGASSAPGWTKLQQIQPRAPPTLPEVRFGVCMRNWMSSEPSTKADRTLNECLQCDEDRSGPVFKATAGRTRRNSGIRPSIARPDDQVSQVAHDYVPVAPDGTR